MEESGIGVEHLEDYLLSQGYSRDPSYLCLDYHQLKEKVPVSKLSSETWYKNRSSPLLSSVLLVAGIGALIHRGGLQFRPYFTIILFEESK